MSSGSTQEHFRDVKKEEISRHRDSDRRTGSTISEIYHQMEICAELQGVLQEKLTALEEKLSPVLLTEFESPAVGTEVAQCESALGRFLCSSNERTQEFIDRITDLLSRSAL